jgi:predicted dehydrogenase
MLGVAILGLGRIGPAHSRVVARTPATELRAVAEADQTKLAEHMERLHGVDGHGDYRESLAPDDIQAVVI